jgi:Zn-dependent protease
MDSASLIQALTTYCMLLVLLSFHEAGHAWTAAKCGDLTAKSLGRVSLNPLVHIDPIGTVILPGIMIIAGQKYAGMPFLFGWAKPVPVNPANLRKADRDGVLIAMAGPAMNLMLAALILPFAKLGDVLKIHWLPLIAMNMTWLSLVLCFFNLIPVPPLDGSHVLKYVTRMSDELYARFAQFGFIILIVLIQFSAVQKILLGTVSAVQSFLTSLYGMG